MALSLGWFLPLRGQDFHFPVAAGDGPAQARWHEGLKGCDIGVFKTGCP